MTISYNELGIWNYLGQATPLLDFFTPINAPSLSPSEIYRINCVGDIPPYAKIWIKQIIGGTSINRWTPFYPELGIKVVEIPIPDSLQGSGLPRYFEVMKSSKYLNDDSFKVYTLSLEEFIPFTITQPGLSDQEKAYLDQLLRRYIQESISGNDDPQFPPIL